MTVIAEIEFAFYGSYSWCCLHNIFVLLYFCIAAVEALGILFVTKLTGMSVIVALFH